MAFLVVLGILAILVVIGIVKFFIFILWAILCGVNNDIEREKHLHKTLDDINRKLDKV